MENHICTVVKITRAYCSIGVTVIGGGQRTLNATQIWDFVARKLRLNALKLCIFAAISWYLCKNCPNAKNATKSN